VFALNCLLHVPRADLPTALAEVRGVLEPGGLLYLGQYGGIDHEGEIAGDNYEPKRFFSWLTDDDLRATITEQFDVVSFKAIDRSDPHAVRP